MLNSKLLCALGLAGLVAGGAAFGAAQVLPVAAGNAFQIAGSTALDNQVKASLLQAGLICQSGTVSIYTDAPALAAVAPQTVPNQNLGKAHQTVVVCNLQALTGTLAAGTKVAFVKESNGGSNEGTDNVANSKTLAFLDATQTPTGCAAVLHVPAGPSAPPVTPLAPYNHSMAYDEYDGCTGPLVNVVPTIGLADEDPVVFNLGPQAVNAATIAKLNTTALFQNQFAIAVSLHQYRALQTLQGLANTDTLATIPTLTSAQVASVLGGVNSSWDTVVSGLAASQVYLCRRGQSSGTNVSADIYFLHNRCSSGHLAMTLATTTNTGTDVCTSLPAGQTVENFGCKWAAANLVDTVFAGAGGGDVDSCLDAHDAAGQNAIGILGATQKFDDLNGVGGARDTGAAHQWRYVAIDGHKPTLEGMANGTYTYAFDNVLNRLNTLTGNPLAVANALVTTFTNPVALSDIAVTQIGDANYQTGGLQDGAVGVRPALPATFAGIQANPTSAMTLQPQGAVDNCGGPVPNGVTLSKEVQ